MQYVPTTGSIPIEITGIQYGLLLFEFVGLIVSIGYFFNRRTDTMATFVYSIFILQIIAVFIAPFLIAARIWPRM
ncbi:hypothetical protein HN512_01275 [Candidatus Peregrinibacteria bacterium]|jgi:hypothetical protein|nr:hypothetical protein [Candidatus Peregrinibacteria bacterium]MBT3598448.1 hypothetical protein [Candidatus Peregrinibacteria bacterium]MBT4585461.1 hypothetical protein [Candidatus Peregrinibacteria bacterium]MBT6730883.1 hypothetical protein [Candidatus Peregrinibacteria bacterium]MBT7009542.1 hypothetical protein [Candidatus Peregrinibacteria bacterium]